SPALSCGSLQSESTHAPNPRGGQRSQQVKRTVSTAAVSVVVVFSTVRPPKIQKPSLVRVKRQSESLEAFWEHFEHAASILLPLEDEHEVSRRGEFHPPALAEPYVNVSAHTAPIMQPVTSAPASSVQTVWALAERFDPTNE